MNKCKEAIEQLRNSFELRHCKWSKNCLDTIEEELEKQRKIINRMTKTMIEYTAKLNIFWCDACNEKAECPFENNVKQCVINYFEKKEIGNE